MPKVIIGETEIEYEDLSNTAKTILKSIKSVDAQIAFKEEEIRILGAAKAMYALKFQEVIKQDNADEEQAGNWLDELGETIQFD